MSPEVHNILYVAMKIVNYVKKNTENSKCFAALCNRMEVENMQLLCHGEVRWLSIRQLLNHLLKTREEMYTLADHYFNNEFSANLAYLSDEFHQLN